MAEKEGRKSVGKLRRGVKKLEFLASFAAYHEDIESEDRVGGRFPGGLCMRCAIGQDCMAAPPHSMPGARHKLVLRWVHGTRRAQFVRAKTLKCYHLFRD